MRKLPAFALVAALSATVANAAVVADSLPYENTPDWSDVVFSGTSMVISGAESVLTTEYNRGVWFGWLAGQNTPGWSIADNAHGNYLSLTAKFSADATDWWAYMADGNRYIQMGFNQTPCDASTQNCYPYGATPGVTLLFAGDLPNTSSSRFIPLDTTEYNSFEWLLLGDTVTYRINGVSYSGTAIASGGQQLLIIGDSSGSSLSGLGQMRISGISFDAAPEFASLPSTVPEPASWAMLIAGFGLTGAALRRRRALFA